MTPRIEDEIRALRIAMEQRSARGSELRGLAMLAGDLRRPWLAVYHARRAQELDHRNQDDQYLIWALQAAAKREAMQRQAQDWLCDNDPEARNFWLSRPPGTNFIAAVRDNLADFGLEYSGEMSRELRCAVLGVAR